VVSTKKDSNNCIVIKVGTSILTSPDETFDTRYLQGIVGDICRLREEGKEMLLVSSGAIGAGIKRLGLKERPIEISMQQAVAACGQSLLMQVYERLFSAYHQKVAQVLLTHRDLAERRSHLNARKTLSILLKYGVVPIINENDTVAIEEIRFGDNDTLAALVSNLVEADLLIILTDIDGLYDDRGTLVEEVEDIDERILGLSSKKSGRFSRGGMLTKVQAARMAITCGTKVVIANGRREGVVMDIARGKKVGTLFPAKEDHISARKRWIGFNLKSAGEVIVDDGAKEAILRSGRSLLPSGIKEVRGKFERGEAVTVMDTNRRGFAKGLVSYSRAEIDKIKGKKTREIDGVLGYKYDDEVIHRDNLVLL
jgi:glutamate 5-kinase